MRVVAIEELTSLAPTQRGIVERLGQWSTDEEHQLLRAHWLDGGDVMIAPWNPEIEPGMEVVAERLAGVLFIDSAKTGDSTEVHWAAALAAER